MIGSRLLSEIPGFLFAMSIRNGGVSPPPLGMNLSFGVGDEEGNVRANRGLFFGRLGIRENDLAIPGQVHGTTVRVVDSPGRVESCDGLTTGRKGVFLCVTVADCMPVVLVDRRAHAFAVVHAGWRGTAGGIAGLAVKAMVREFQTDPSDVVAYLGPAAGSCCYEVGDDVAGHFPSEAVARRDGKLFVDLQHANLLQIRHAGVDQSRVEASNLCTICNSDRFHSFRRDGSRSGRMMAVAGFASAKQPL